jgi:signal transduction histidine kinase
LRLILHDLVELYQPQAEAKEISLSANLIGHLFVLGDLVQLTRVFANLIENALQYTLQGGIVEIQTLRVGQQLSVKVKDTGIGMTPEQLEHVFERFWRADEGRNYRAGGFGLGLAIAQSTIQNHGGTLTVTSQLGVGSCFTVQLPEYYV